MPPSPTNQRAASAQARPADDPAGVWHTLPADEVVSRLQSTRTGLTDAQASQRLLEHGPNALEVIHGRSPWTILREQFRNVLILILLVATALSAYLGHGVEAAAITVIVLFAVVLGFLQEYRAERAIEALRELAAPTATVLRRGEELELSARDLVPGDIVLLRAGHRIPADVRLLEVSSLQIQEAALTGESVAVDKEVAPLAMAALPLGDRRNMAYAGTVATYGRGVGVVVGTGMRTEFGRIAHSLQTVETSRTPLQENLDRLGRALAWVAGAVVGIIVVLGVIRGQPIVEMLVFGIALAVAVVPEALPAVVTISLARGVRRLVKRGALMRRLPAVETLGSTSIICSDKTGTLTRDEMTVRQVYVAGRAVEVSGTGYEPHGDFSIAGQRVAPAGPLERLLEAAALASDAHVARRDADGGWHVHGDPTEAALVVAAAKAGLVKSDLESRFPRVHEIPFAPETRRMTTLHTSADGPVACSKGAPEVILEACASELLADGTPGLDDARRQEILEASRRMARQALRVLAVARKAGATPADAERDMTFLGLVGLIDPPRAEARAAIETCERAGVRVVMITGDHPLTAGAIARELGILRQGRVVTGTDLDAMDDATLDGAVDAIEAYARVSPQHKLRVVAALQRRGQIVAMTGDGVNDAPALKKADIGIAMGITGTDVAREAAAMTLTDDNFASIVAAVEEGRGIFGNIKKYLMFLLSSNLGEIGLMAGTTMLGLPLPLTAVQILYVNLATDGLPALALAVDPPEPDLMGRPPRPPRSGIFTRPVVALMAIGGGWSAAVTIGMFAWALEAGRSPAHAMAMTFLALVLIQFFKAYSFRSDRVSLRHRPFANRWLNLAIFWELVLLMGIVYVPILQVPFGTFDLRPVDWLTVAGAAATVVPVLELGKWMVRRGWFGAIG